MKLIFNHVAFTVNDLDESSKWYADKLGMKESYRYDSNGMQFIVMKSSGLTIELFNFGKNTKQLPSYRKELIDDLHTVGTKHLGIETDNLEKSIADLKRKGVEFVDDIDTAATGGRFIFFRDCNGILVELYEHDKTQKR